MLAPHIIHFVRWLNLTMMAGSGVLLLVVGCNAVPASGNESIIVADDFEGDTWDPYWREEIPFDYSLRLAPDPAGDGQSLRFEWRREDYKGDRWTKGVELKTPPEFSPTAEQWLGFRIYFDREKFGPDGEPVVLMQYHGLPDFDLGEGWRNPVTALAYYEGELRYDYRGSKPRVTPGEPGNWEYTESGRIPIGEPEWDAWNTFVFYHRFDPTGNDGQIIMWFNGERFELDGINVGFNDEVGPYWKFGFYYYTGQSDFDRRVMYYDDVTLAGAEASYEDVKPGDP